MTVISDCGMIVQINSYKTMAVSRLCIPFLVNAATVLISVSGTKYNLKNVCLFDTVQLFQNLEFDPCNGYIYLTVSGKSNTVIATWSYEHCIQNQNVSNEYTDRLLLDENGTITMHNITDFDEGKYIVHNQLSAIQQVNIEIHVAPSEDCIPIIERVENTLNASLKQSCGRPKATPYWKGVDGKPDIHHQVLPIPEGTESGLYTACIEGPALQCEKTLLQRNQCSTFVINRSTNGTESAAPRCTECLGVPVFVIILHFAILLLILVVVCVIMIKQLSGYGCCKCYQIFSDKTKRKYNKKLETRCEEKTLRSNTKKFRSPTINMNQIVHTYVDIPNWTDIIGLLSTDQKMHLQRYYYNLNWMNIIVLLNHVQQMLLETYCYNLRSPTINMDQHVHPSFDIPHLMNIIELLIQVQLMTLQRHHSLLASQNKTLGSGENTGPNPDQEIETEDGKEEGLHSIIAILELNAGLRQETASETEAGNGSDCSGALNLYDDSKDTQNQGV